MLKDSLHTICCSTLGLHFNDRVIIPWKLAFFSLMQKKKGSFQEISPFGWLMGFEPTTNGTTNHYSNQLSYSHRFKVMQNYGFLVNCTRKIFTCSHVHIFICSHRGVYCLKMKLLPFNLYFVGMGMAIYMFTYSHVHMFISRVGAWKWGCYHLCNFFVIGLVIDMFTCSNVHKFTLLVFYLKMKFLPLNLISWLWEYQSFR